MKKLFIKKVSVSPLRALLHQPFTTALGAHNSLDNILLTVELNDGTKGFGEAAIAPHITGETVKETKKNLEAFKKYLISKSILDYLKISFNLHARLSNNKSAIAAVEMALLDTLTRKLKIPLWKFFGKRCHKLQTDITVVISGLQETEMTVKKYYAQGFRTFKVKVGRNQDEDFKRVLLVKKLAPNAKIIVDANQGYSADETLKFLKLLERNHIRPILIEQPVAKNDWEGLKKVTWASKIPVCADESVSSLLDAVRAIKEKAAHVINIKLMKFGLLEAREVALLAKSFGLKLMIGGMMETSLAMTASAHLAAGLGCFDYIDLDTPYFIKKDFERNPYLNSSGIYNLKKVKEGIGIIPN